MISAISLFSGMGGDTLGINNAGGKVIAFNEFDKHATSCHELNFPDTELIYDDSHKKDKDKTNISLIRDEIFEKYAGKVDLIFAGHPCQGFSQGGKKLPDDPRNTLFREFARSAKLIKPKFIIGENVDGLLSRKTATGEKYIDVIVSEFNNIGYNVYYQVCHAVQYGVPQLRKRLVYVGIRQDIDVGVEDVESVENVGVEGVEENDDNSQSGFHFPEPLNDRKTNLPNLKKIVKYNMTGAIKIDPEDFDMTSIPKECILRNMKDNSNEDSDNIHPYLRLKAKTRGQTYNGKTFDNTLSFAKRESPIHAEVIDIRAPSKTIICTYDHQPRLFVPLQNKNGYFLRPLLPDELKQIQGFPANFKLNGSVKEQIKQIGNAAPPPLVYQVVKQILKIYG